MNPRTAFSAMRLLRALSHSIHGLRVGFSTERALRLEFVVLLGLVPVAWILKEGALERAVLIGSWLGVIVVELINSAIETIVDRIGKEHHELSGRAKDLGSAAVFGAVVSAGVVWLLILFH